MMKRFIAAAALFLAASLPAAADVFVRTSVDLSLSGWQLISNASAMAECDFPGCILAVRISGRHAVTNDIASVIASESFNGAINSWSGTLYPSGARNTCYRASLDATTEYGQSQSAGTAATCIPTSLVAADDPAVQFQCIESDGCADPIVIRLSNGAYDLSTVADPVTFDVDHNGVREQTSWTARDSDTAFLAIDRNGNGTIDDGGELFGNGTRLANGEFAPNGFQALAELDSNHDGVIDASDTAWDKLLLWIDRNHDGVSGPAETSPISQSRMTSIDIECHWTGRVDAGGTRYGYEAHLHEGNVTRSFYDVFLRMVAGTNGVP